MLLLLEREREGGRPGSGRGSKQNKSNIPDKGERGASSPLGEKRYFFSPSFIPAATRAARNSRNKGETTTVTKKTEEQGLRGGRRWGLRIVDGSTLFISASFAFRFQGQKKEERERQGGRNGRYISPMPCLEEIFRPVCPRIVAR